MSLGVRVFTRSSLGFATVNGADRLDEACRDALAMAAAAPPDPLNGLDDPRPVTPLDRPLDPGITALDVTQLVDHAMGLLRRVKERDPRVRIDAGSARASLRSRAIATSTGVRLSDERATAWEATHHLIERLNVYGEEGAARLLARMPPDLAAEARQLAYRLYSICERKGWAEQARDYNALVISWGASQERAQGYREEIEQGRLF